MKKIISVSLALILVFTACFCLSSCSIVGKSELPSIDSRLIGTWVSDEPSKSYSYPAYDIFIFFSNGTVIVGAFSVSSEFPYNRENACSFVAENNIVAFINGTSTLSYVYSIKGNKLETTSFGKGEKQEFTRIKGDLYSYLESLANK